MDSQSSSVRACSHQLDNVRSSGGSIFSSVAARRSFARNVRPERPRNPVTAPAPAGPGSDPQQLLVRRLVAAGVGLVVIIVLVLGVKGCLNSRQEQALKDYNRDVASLVQESDSKLTLFPYGDLGIAFYSGEGAVKSASVNFGVWNALLTGSSGLDGDRDKLHYEEDFYATLNLGFARGFSLGTTYTAYTSPNGMFGTVQELMFKVSKSHMLAPYGTLAFELDGQADGGSNEGVYLELGVAPSWPLAAHSSRESRRTG